jgi:ABC-type phosphate transport system substrate-binding protein
VALGAIVLSVTVSATMATPPKSWATDASATLFGEGGSFELPLMDALQNSAEGVAAVAPLAPGFFNANIDQARDDFASGAADYAVSELPLTATEAATAAHNGRTFAYVPFAASPLAICTVLERSNDSSLTANTMVPDIQLSIALVAKAMTNGLSSWNDPSFSQASGGKPIFTDDESANIHPVNQVEPSAVTLALESSFVNDPTTGDAAKPVWDAFIARLKKTDDTPTELWPTNGGITGGDRAVADALIPVNETTLIPDPHPNEWGNGDIAALPTDWLGPPRNVGILPGIPTIAILNAAGAYVSPTVPAMTAALQDAKFDSSTNLVTYQPSTTDAAAYPIPTMSYLVVPTSGLSPAKATALAAFIRYVLGPKGQAVVASFGAAPVTTPMVSAGLQVAKTVAVEANPAPTTTTTTTTTPKTTTTTTLKKTTVKSATVVAVHPRTAAQGSSGTATTVASATGPTLASTGGPPWPLPVLGGVLLFVGVFARRVLWRRLRPSAAGQGRGAAP